MVEVSCREVVREISNYLEGDLDAGLRVMLERHFAGCRHCTAVVNGARNIMVLSGDDRSFALPSGFSQRLQEKLLPRTRRTARKPSKRE